MIVAALVALALAPCHLQAGGALPDLRCTQGAIVSGSFGVDPWDRRTCSPEMRTVAPTGSRWGLLVEVARRYSVDPRTVALDLVVPVGLGGDPDSLANAWPIPRRFLAAKRRAEAAILGLCWAGRLPVFVARGLIATDWRAAARYAAWAATQQ